MHFDFEVIWRSKTNHFLGSRRPLNETPQVGCLSRSGVNKSVWRDGLKILINPWTLNDFLYNLDQHNYGQGLWTQSVLNFDTLHSSSEPSISISYFLYCWCCVFLILQKWWQKVYSRRNDFESECLITKRYIIKMPMFHVTLFYPALHKEHDVRDILSSIRKSHETFKFPLLPPS